MWVALNTFLTFRLIETSKGLYKAVNETKKNIPVTEAHSHTDVRAGQPHGAKSPGIGIDPKDDSLPGSPVSNVNDSILPKASGFPT